MKWIPVSLTFFLSTLSFLLRAQEAPGQIDGVFTVNAKQAKRLYDAGALFIDVRPYEQWQSGHVDRAQNLDLLGSFRQLMVPGILEKKTPIVIYGNSTYHMRGAIGSYMAAIWGYERVFFLRDGYYGWLALDYPVVLKSDVLEKSVSVTRQ